jgi:hypothetical protein
VLGVQDIAEIVLEGMYSWTEKHVPIARFREYAGETERSAPNGHHLRACSRLWPRADNIHRQHLLTDAAA